MHDPAVAQGVISAARNRIGLPGYPTKPHNTLDDVANTPNQFQGIGDPKSDPWRKTQNPSTMNTDEQNTYNQYQDVVRQQLSGQLPDNTGGATFFYNGNPSDKRLATMSDRPLEQTAQIGSFRFYKPKY